MLRSYEILCYNKRLRNIYQEMISHIVIDEFQDTNYIQYEWIKILTLKSKSIVTVCDDDQLIYEWRGANVNNIKLFKEEYKKVCIFYLEQNYRSNSNILMLANSLISNNKNRFKKNLWSLKNNRNGISLYQAKDDINECLYIINEIKKLQTKSVNINDICILYRSKYQARIIEEFFIKEGIPYSILSKKNFFQRSEIQAIVNYLKLIVDFKHNNSFLKILNIRDEIDKKSVLKIIKIMSKKKNITYMQATVNILKQNELNKSLRKCKAYILNILKILDQLCTLYKKNICLNKICRFILKNETFNFIIKLNKYSKEKSLLNARLFIFITKKFLYLKKFTNFRESLRELYLYILVYLKNSNIEKSSSVKMMTVHAAKGLEFEYVFIYGLEEGLFPISKKQEEERRLLYVAITRTKSQLFFTYSKLRKNVFYKKIQNPSRFLIEIPIYLIKKKVQKVLITFINNNVKHLINRKIFHRVFGIGVIIRYNREEGLIHVHFSKDGHKKINIKNNSIKLI